MERRGYTIIDYTCTVELGMSSGTTRATYQRWDQIRWTLCRPCRRRLPRNKDTRVRIVSKDQCRYILLQHRTTNPLVMRLIIPRPAHQHFTPTLQRPMSQNLINLITRIMIVNNGTNQRQDQTIIGTRQIRIKFLKELEVTNVNPWRHLPQGGRQIKLNDQTPRWQHLERPKGLGFRV